MYLVFYEDAKSLSLPCQFSSTKMSGGFILRGTDREIIWNLIINDISFFQVRNEFYKDTQGALLVYDVTNRESFESLESWLDEIKKEINDTTEVDRIIFVVCANKVWKTVTLGRLWLYVAYNLSKYGTTRKNIQPYHIDMSVLLENAPLVNFVRSYIWDTSDIFSISSLVKISMTSLPTFSRSHQ